MIIQIYGHEKSEMRHKKKNCYRYDRNAIDNIHRELME